MLSNRVNKELKYNKNNFYSINFRPRQTRRQYFDLPRKNKGRVRYQVNKELDGFRKGDLVLVKNKWVKQINSIYSNKQFKFKFSSSNFFTTSSKNCKLLLKNVTLNWT